MPKYKVKREGGDCLRCILFFYSIIFWAANLVLIFLGLWTLLDPRRSYVIDLINFAEGAPTLRYAAFVSVFTGCWGLLIGFVVFCGAHTRIRTLLGWDTLFLSLLFCAGIAMAALALSFRNEMAQTLPSTLRQIIKRQYGVVDNFEKNEEISKIVDKIQFYQQCCGSLGPSDYMGSLWMEHVRGSVNIDEEISEVDKKLVPVSCCTQIIGASALNPLAKSEARCQQIGATKSWRHSKGCHEKLQNVISEHAWIFAGCGIGYSAIMMIGICFTSLLCSKVRYYYHAPDDISEALETQEYH